MKIVFFFKGPSFLCGNLNPFGFIDNGTIKFEKHKIYYILSYKRGIFSLIFSLFFSVLFGFFINNLNVILILIAMNVFIFDFSYKYSKWRIKKIFQNIILNLEKEIYL